MPGLEMRINWGAVAAHVLHPRKVEIIEALAYVRRPLSTTDWLNILGVDDGEVTLQQVNHHLVHLASQGVFVLFEGDVEVVGPRGNAKRIYYTFAPEVLR